MMRLLMLNNEFPPLGGGTGTVNRAVLLCLAQVPDLEIDLITSALGKQFKAEPFASTFASSKSRSTIGICITPAIASC